MASITWRRTSRNYEKEDQRQALSRNPSSSFHPLLSRKGSIKTGSSLSPEPPQRAATPVKRLSSSPLATKPPPASSPSTTALDEDELDPLSAMLLQPPGAGQADPAFLDPLMNPPPSPHSRYNQAATPSSPSIISKGGSPSWSIRKQVLLAECAISGSIRVRARLLSSSQRSFDGGSENSGSRDEWDDEGRSPAIVASKAVDRYQHRLGQLEAGSDDTKEMSQKEYLGHVEKLQTDLKRAWLNEERVKSLKLSIQCAKLLGDTMTQPRYYPFMWVHITDVLDHYGSLVYDRIKSKAVDHLRDPDSKRPPPPLPDDFRSRDVSPEAKETCRNWFFKTACIREMLPRLYIEMALARSYRFLADNEYPVVITRLGSMLRGLGDPLIAVYARAYLARQMIALDVPDAATKPVLLALLSDQLTHFRDFQSREKICCQYLARTGLTNHDYIHLLAPAMDWMYKVLAREHVSTDLFQTVLVQYRDLSNAAPILRLILDNFPGSFYSSNSIAMMALIKMASEATPQELLDVLEALGRRLQDSPPPEKQSLPLLNEVWRIITKATSDLLASYVAAAGAWMGLALKSNAYGEREILIMLADLAKHLEQAQAAASIQIDGSGGNLGLGEEGNNQVMNALESVMSALVLGSSSQETAAILTSEHLGKIMDCIRPSRRVEMCKDLLEGFGSKKQETTSDPVLIHALLDLCRTLHDSIDSLSPEGERRHISLLICGFVARVDFGQDLEQALNLYVDCRAAFANLDLVLYQLIMLVVGLAIKAYDVMNGRHSKKTSSFVKACLAYCHITIPSISDIFKRLNLTLLCGQVALMNQCLPQTDSFMKATISMIPEVPAFEEIDYQRLPTETRLVSIVQNLLSTLVAVPGHPEHGPFYLVQGLLNALPRYEGWSSRTALLPTLHIQALGLLAASGQRKLPYTLKGVEANDVLYGGSPDYMAELEERFQSILDEVLKAIAALGQQDGSNAVHNKLRQASLALNLANQLSIVARPGQEIRRVLFKLMELAASNLKQGGSGGGKPGAGSGGEGITAAYLDRSVQHLIKVLEEDYEVGIGGAAEKEEEEEEDRSFLVDQMRALVVA